MEYLLCIPCFIRGYILHMVMYMFQCYSLISSPNCPKSLCLHCCLASRIISTIFLDSIYMHSYMMFVFLFLTYFTLYNGLYVSPPQFNWPKSIPFYGWFLMIKKVDDYALRETEEEIRDDCMRSKNISFFSPFLLSFTKIITSLPLSSPSWITALS